MANDFFVRFGSNAKVFSGELETDLAGARQVIGRLGQGLQALETTAATKKTETLKHLAALATEADRVQKKLDALGEPGSQGEAAEVRNIARAAIQDIQTVAASVDGLVTQITAVTRALGGITPAAKKAAAAENRSQGQRDSSANQNRVRDPATGRVAASGTAGASPFYQAQQRQLGEFINNVQRQIAAQAARSAPAAGAPAPVTISSIPQATIDEASFARVVQAMQENVAQGKRIESAVERVVASVNRIGTGAGGVTGVQTGVETPDSAAENALSELTKLTRQQNRDLAKAFRDVLKSTGDNFGPEKAKELFQTLAAQQREALANGGTIIKEGALDDQPAGPNKRQRKLTADLDSLDRATITLRTELEQMAGDLEAGRGGAGGRDLAAAQATYGRKLEELAALETRHTSTTKALVDEESKAVQAERQRRETIRRAQAQAGITISGDERNRRQSERGALELAANPEQLRAATGRGAGQMGKRQLQDIAETLTRQGYNTDLGKSRERDGLSRLTVPQILERIEAAGKQYVEAGRATNEDLSLRRVAAGPSEISPDVKQVLSGSRVEALAAQFDESVKAAYKLMGEDLKTGGIKTNDTDARGIRSNDKTASGRRQVGAATGEEGRAQLEQAIALAKQYNLARINAGRDDARERVRADPNFNPYTIDRTVVGKDDEAQGARRNLRTLTAGVDELDDFARELIGLDEAVAKTQRVFLAITRDLIKYESLERKPTDEEAAKYSRDTARQPEVEKQLAEQRAALARGKATYRDPSGGSADYLLEAQYREGLRRRDESRAGADRGFVENAAGQTLMDRQGKRVRIDETYDANERNQSAARFQNQSALRSAIFDFFGRAKVFGTNDGNTKDYVTRALPGVRAGGSAGRQRLEFINDEDNGTATNRRALARMTAGITGYSTYLERLIFQLADSSTDEHQLNETREKLSKALNKLLSGYQTAFPSQQVPDARSFLPPELGVNSQALGKDATAEERRAAARADNVPSDQELSRRDKSDAARAKVQESLDATDTRDPDRAAKMQADLLKSLKVRIKQLKSDISQMSALSGTLVAAPNNAGQIEQAKRDLTATQTKRRSLSGNFKPEELETAAAALATRLKEQTKAEAALAKTTADLATTRQKVAAAELAVRERLGSSAPEYDKTLAERDRLQTRASEITNSDDYRADRELGPENQARQGKAEAELVEVRRKLSAVEAQMQQYDRLAASLDPQAKGVRTLPDRAGLTKDAATQAEKRANQSAELKVSARAIEKAAAALEEMKTAFAASQTRQGAKALRDPNIEGFVSGRGVGGGGGDGGTTAQGASEPEDGRGNNVLRQILLAIKEVNTTLKSGVRVSGRASGVEGEGAAKKTAPTKKAAAERVGYTGRSTEQGRADFEAAVGQQIPAVGQALAQAKDLSSGVAAATELVTRGILSETDAINYFRDQLKLTRAEASQLGEGVRKGVGNARLNSAASAAGDQRSKEEQKAASRAEKAAKRAAEEAEKAAARTNRANTTAARALREESLAQAEMQRTMDRLSPATRKEVAELERMARASDDSAESQEKLAQKMARVYGLMAQDLHATGTPNAEGVRTENATNINRAATATFQGAGIETSGAEIQGIRRQARGLGHQVDAEAAAGVGQGGLFGEQSAFTRRMFGQAGFWSRVMSSTGAFVVRNFTAGFVFGLTNALQEVIGEAIQTEATFVRVSHALEATGRSSNGLRGDLQGIATDLGTNLNDVYQTAAGLTGLFKTPQEIAGATKVVSQLSLISAGALNAQEAMGTLASIQGAFGKDLEGGVDGLEHIADVLTSIQNTVGTNVEVVAEGIGRMSGLAQQLGLSLEEVGVYTAQIAKLTNQTGAAAGEQFSRILSVIQTGRGRSAIQANFGEVTDRDEAGNVVKGAKPRDTGVGDLLATRDYSGVLKVMSAEWKNLSKAQQQNVSVSIAGQRQAAAFAALLNNGAQSADAISRAEDSHGAAEERVTKIMQTLNGQIEKLGSNFQVAASNLIRSGILNFVIVLLKATNGLLSGFNKVFTVINDFADKSPILSFLADMTFGILGLALALTVVRKAFQGFKASIQATPSAQAFQNGVAGRNADGTARPAGPTAGQRVTAVRDRFIDRVSAVRPDRVDRAGNSLGTNQFGERNVGNGPLTRGFGAVIDRGFTRPLSASGASLTRFGAALEARSAQLRREGSTPRGVDSEGRQLSQLRRAALLGSSGGAIGQTGAFTARSAQFGASAAANQQLAASLRTLAQGATDSAVAARLNRQAVAAQVRSVIQGGAARITGQGIRGVSINPQGSGIRYGAGATAGYLGDRLSAAGNFARNIGNGQFLQRGADRLADRSRTFGNNASINRTTASALSGLADRTNDPAEAQRLRRQAAGYTAMARAGSLASTVTERVGNGLRKLSAGGVAAEAALAAFTIAFGLLMANADQEAQAATSLAKVQEARKKAQNSEDAKDDPYKGLAQEEYETTTKNFTDKGSQFQGGSAVAGGILKGIFTGKDPITAFNQSLGTSGANPLAFLGIGGAGQTFGLDQANSLASKGSKQLQDAAKKGGIKDIIAAQKKLTDQQNKAIEGVEANGDLSKTQKLAFNANMEQVTQILQDQAEVLIAQSKGLADAALLENEQIKRIGESSQQFVALNSGGDTQRQYRQGLEGLEDESGLDDKNNPELKQAMDRLTKGGLSTAQAAQERTKILKALADQAEIKYLAALKTGETDLIDDSRAQFTSLVQQVADATLANVQTYVQSASALADAAAQAGDFEGERSELTTALRNIQAERPEGVITKSGKRKFSAADEQLNAQIDAQARPVQQRIDQSLINEANNPLKLNAAQNPGALNQASAAVQQAQNTLTTLQASRDANGKIGASEQDILEAQIALITAQQGYARSLNDQNAASIAQQIAGEWNQAKIDMLNVAKANADLAYAVANFPAGSAEVLAAQGALDGAKKQRAQGNIDRRAGKRAADIAAIPQGNAVGVANAQVAAAAAAAQDAKQFGLGSTQYQGALAQLSSAQQQASAATAAVGIAQAQLAQAYAQASGNAVGAAQAGVAVANAQLAAAQQASGGAVTAETLGAQASLVAANQAVQDAQVALVQSRIQVTIALADAAGNTVKSARLQIQAALAQLKSETPGTAEFNQAKAAVISARAAARDAELQDRLDTIDFNLQMGKITQSSAISALQQILKTSDLTKQQRRQLLLQIKGMKEEMADSQFNFGDIKLPTPYQVRRYAQEQLQSVRAAATGMQQEARPRSGAVGGFSAPSAADTTYNNASTSNTTTVNINGSNLTQQQLRQVVESVVGRPSRTTTTAPRRRIS